MTDSIASEKESPPDSGNGEGFRIVRLEASNVKRLKAITIEPHPDASVVIVGGNNGEGKSSTLDAIMYAVGGKDAVCVDPIRHGQKAAEAVVYFGNYVATRRFARNGAPGGTLTLKTKEGLNVPSPQTFLDGLLGQLSFDPLAFSRMAPRKRREVLQSLVTLSIDLEENATKRKAAYDQRTDLDRKSRDIEGELRQTPEPDKSLPAESVDVSALVNEKNALEARSRTNASFRRSLESERAELGALNTRFARLIIQHQEIEKEIECTRNNIEEQSSKVSQFEETASQLDDPDCSVIDAQIAEASDKNVKIAAARVWRIKYDQKRELDKRVSVLSDAIKGFEDERVAALSAAVFPISGLSFDEGDVSFNGILFDQLSSSEQLRVSLAMAMAMNPRLRVIRIMDGSLLDETSMGIVREMAREKAYQVWIEVVGNRQDATVIIEDGAVVGAEEVVEPELEVAS